MFLEQNPHIPPTCWFDGDESHGRKNKNILKYKSKIVATVTNVTSLMAHTTFKYRIPKTKSEWNLRKSWHSQKAKKSPTGTPLRERGV